SSECTMAKTSKTADADQLDSGTDDAQGKQTLAGGQTLGGGKNINQIRDILIGPFQRETDGKFRASEESLNRLSDMHSERMDLMQSRLEKAVDHAVEDLTSRMKRMDDHLQGMIRAQDKAMNTGFEHIRRDIDQKFRDLQNSKTGREDLADYLVEIGMRLKQEPTLNAIEDELRAITDAEDQDAHEGDDQGAEVNDGSDGDDRS
ncbi:MAG: hypothetical protein AAF220_05075, partial [Pseudomonadota bacterium]